jgi:hypothetical protein
MSRFSSIMWREQVIFQWDDDDDDVRVVLDQHVFLNFYSTISLKQQSAGRHVAPLGNALLILNQTFFVTTP